MLWLRGGLALIKALRFWYHSILDSNVVKKEKKCLMQGVVDLIE